MIRSADGVLRDDYKINFLIVLMIQRKTKGFLLKFFF